MLNSRQHLTVVHSVVCHTLTMCARGKPLNPNIRRSDVIRRVKADLLFGYGRPPNCEGTKEFKARRYKLVNECGLYYHRQFHQKTHQIISITFWRVPNTQRMEIIEPLTPEEQQLLRSLLQNDSVEMNFQLMWSQKRCRYECPGRYK